MTNVSFTESDVSEVRASKRFYAAVGRFILQFVSDPVAVLRCLSRLIRAGGASSMAAAPRSRTRQGAILAKLVRWYTPAELLKMATADNGELMALTGFINPYPGKLGVVEQGALADLLLVDGNPIENIKLIEDPEKTFWSS
jgi:hypothetical protein